MSEKITIPFDEPLLPSKAVSVGKLTFLYEHGRIRYVKYDNLELIRMIYFAVRDEHWKTAEYSIENELCSEAPDRFSSSYTSVHNMNNILYSAQVEITCVHDVLTFKVTGTALTSFKRNRIGICILHPVDKYAGKIVDVVTPNNETYSSQFPNLISPHQPLKNIRELHYGNGGNFHVRFSFSGDIFETEDQRNWGDSTFKTYSTPHNIPIPVEVHPGDTVEQSVKIKFAGNAPKAVNNVPRPQSVPFPKLGYASRIDGAELNENEILLLKQIQFDHYRVDLNLFEADWHLRWTQHVKEVMQFETRMELVVHVDDHFDAQLDNLLHTVESEAALIESIMVVKKAKSTPDPLVIETVYRKVKKRYSHIQVGYGTDGFFADLNRNRPNELPFDFVSFSLNPQVHATDTRSLIENLQQLCDAVDTIRSFAPGKKIHISPITFKMRSGPGDETDFDPRQQKNFGAMWTLACIQQLAAADRLTFYQVAGYRGLLKNVDGAIITTPLFDVLRKLKKFQPVSIVTGTNFPAGEFPEKILFKNESGETLLVCGERSF